MLFTCDAFLSLPLRVLISLVEVTYPQIFSAERCAKRGHLLRFKGLLEAAHIVHSVHPVVWQIRCESQSFAYIAFGGLHVDTELEFSLLQKGFIIFVHRCDPP